MQVEGAKSAEEREGAEPGAARHRKEQLNVTVPVGGKHLCLPLLFSSLLSLTLSLPPHTPRSGPSAPPDSKWNTTIRSASEAVAEGVEATLPMVMPTTATIRTMATTPLALPTTTPGEEVAPRTPVPEAVEEVPGEEAVRLWEAKSQNTRTAMVNINPREHEAPNAAKAKTRTDPLRRLKLS
jgi:hypothetical protein